VVVENDPGIGFSGLGYDMSADGTKLFLATAIANGGPEASNTLQVSASNDSGVNWGQPVDVSNPVLRASDVRIHSSEDGNLVTVVWMSIENIPLVTAYRRIMTSTSSDAGASWSTPTQVSSESVQTNDILEMAGSDDGTKITVVWRKGDAPTSIQASSSTDFGITWSTPVVISGPGTGPVYPVITSSADGSKLAVAWHEVGSNFNFRTITE